MNISTSFGIGTTPPPVETRPEYLGQVFTSTQPLSNHDRLRLWHAKINIIDLEAWKRRTSEARS